MLRHDIDTSLEKAVKFSEFERELGVKSAYFSLITSDFYNALSKKNSALLRKISDLGHEVGLHFDETTYNFSNTEEIKSAIKREAKLLSEIIGKEVKCVSMHRPSKRTLEADIKIEGMVNSYGAKFFKEYKYLSDSRRNWREPAKEIIASEKYDKLQILTHPFWYNDTEKDLPTSVKEFVNGANKDRYFIMKENITDLGAIMNEEEILCEAI